MNHAEIIAKAHHAPLQTPTVPEIIRLQSVKLHMKHVVNFSGGLCSFWAAHRVIQKYGTQDVTLLFADTLIEDADLYRFNDECSAFLGVPITRICEGRTPWQLFRDEGLIGSSRVPLCSIRLKRELLNRWHRQNCLEMDTIIYIGMDWTEENRLRRLRDREPNWRWEAPMMEEPIWDKCKMTEELQKIGIELPRLYKLGFPHNNCGGRCVSAGHSHWAHLYRVDRDAFMEWADEEAATMAEFEAKGINSFTILKYRRGGETKSITLYQLAQRIDDGEKIGLDDWGACGCSTQV